MKIKTAILISLGLILIISKIQSQETPIEPISYSEIVYVDSTVSADQLFLRARSWFADVFKDSKEVLQMEDEKNGKLIGRSLTEFYSRYLRGNDATRGAIHFDITIWVKDGRYRYSISNFTHESFPINGSNKLSFGLLTTSSECPIKFTSSTSKKWRNKIWNELKEVPQYVNAYLINTLKPAMENEKDNW